MSGFPAAVALYALDIDFFELVLQFLGIMCSHGKVAECFGTFGSRQEV